MDYKDIVTKRTYEQMGETKTKWLKVGTLKTTGDGKQFIEINLLPDTSLYVFEPKPRESSGHQETYKNDNEEVPF